MAKLKKALIPAAGFGTRLFPITKVFKKEFFPIIDGDGQAKPIILKLVEEVLSTGIEEVGIVIQESDRALFSRFFHQSASEELSLKLSPENQAFDRYLTEMGQKITLIPQNRPEGYGHAVYSARNWINGEPFLLSLGDHLYRSNTEISCARQLKSAYERYGISVIALTIMSEDILYKAGIIGGDWLEEGAIIKIDRVREKPTVKDARACLRVEGLKEGDYLGAFGLYILEPAIFEHLEAEIQSEGRDRGEFQLTTALDALVGDRGLLGYLVQGHYFDTGMPDFYRQTMIDFS